MRLSAILARLLFGAFLLLFAALAFLLLAPRGEAQAFPAGWTPIRDDARAASLLPGLRSAAEEAPLAAKYRAARGPDGRLYFGYHFIWAREENPARGFGPALSRALYTGGLSLQRLMFGKGDVELVVVEADAEGRALAFSFEEAKDYDPASFSVTHSPARALVEGGGRALLEVMSWNHLFRALPQGSAVDADPPLGYFDEAAWREYSMSKERPSFLRRNRALAPWELETAGE